MEDHARDENSLPKIDVEKSSSKLARPIKEIVTMVFDKDMIEEALQEFEVYFIELIKNAACIVFFS